MAQLVTLNNISTAHITVLYYINTYRYGFSHSLKHENAFLVFSKGKLISPLRPTLETLFANLNTFHFFLNLMSLQYEESLEGIRFLLDITVCTAVDRLTRFEGA